MLSKSLLNERMSESHYHSTSQKSKEICTGGACFVVLITLQAIGCYGLKHVFKIIYMSFL